MSGGDLERADEIAAPSQQVSALTAVVQLDQALTRVLAHVDLLRECPFPLVVASVGRSMSVAVAAMAAVREQVLDDGDEATIEEVERVLRTRAAVVMVQLDELRAAEPECDASSVTGRIRSVGDLDRALVERIGRINACLARVRREIDASGPGRIHQQALYRVALGNAEYGYAALGTDPDVRAFLRVGAASGSRRFRLACRMITCVLAPALSSSVIDAGYSEVPCRERS